MYIIIFYSDNNIISNSINKNIEYQTKYDSPQICSTPDIYSPRISTTPNQSFSYYYETKDLQEQDKIINNIDEHSIADKHNEFLTTDTNGKYTFKNN